MILKADIHQKSMGNKKLFARLNVSVNKNEKIAVIGRNGIGKTTLFNMLAGTDTDYDGDIERRRGLKLVATAQEHLNPGSQSVLDYIYDNLPGYRQMQEIIATYPGHMGNDIAKISRYTRSE